MPDKIRVKLVDNGGDGVTETCRVDEGTTIEQFLRLQEVAPEGRVIRVNHDPAEIGQELYDGDIVTVCPKKVAGA